MLKFILKRIVAAFAIAIIMSILVFFMIKMIPGDPIIVMFGKNPIPEKVEELRHLYGFDKPLWQQYFVWLSNLLHGNWGTSIILELPVIDLVMARLPRTAILCFAGIFLSIIIAIPSGIVSAVKHNTLIDVGITTVNLFFISVPLFWLGILLIILFAVQWHILPAVGYVSPKESISGFIRCMILPTLTTAACFFAALSRVVRSSMLDVLDQDYIALAKVKGNPPYRVTLIHALRNTLIPIVSIVGLQIGYFLGGQVIVEKVFAFPGMGLLLLNAINQRDYPLIQGTIFIYALIIVAVNLLTDLAYALIDPKIRYSNNKKQTFKTDLTST